MASWKRVLTSSDVTNFNLGNTNLTITAGVGRSITLGNASSSLTVFNNASTDIFNLTETTQRIGGGTNASISIDGNSITVDKTNEFIIESEDNDSDSMPVLKLFRNSTSPSDNDEIGEVRFTGEDSVGIETTYATIEGLINQESQSGEDGSLKISVTSQASLTEAFTVGPDGNSSATTSKTADEQKLDAISVYGKSLLNLASRSVAMYQYGENQDFTNNKNEGAEKIYMRGANGVRLGPGNNLNLSEDNYLGTVMHRDGFITAGSMNYHIKDITDSSVDYVATLKVLVINGNGANYTVELCEINDNGGVDEVTRSANFVRTSQARSTTAGSNCEFFEAGDRLVPFVELDVDAGNSNSHSVTLEDFVVNVEVLFEDTTAS